MDSSVRLAGYESGEIRLALRIFVCALLLAAAAMTAEAGPCDPPVSNPIVCENSQPGNPASEWDISGAGDPTIQGFATDISVNHGETVRFKVSTNATAYHLDIYRLGYYAGSGARLVVGNILPTAALPQTQPACLNDPLTGLNDCGNWSESASWSVPADAVSGIYIARLVRNDTLGASHIAFVVRDDEGHSPLLFQTSDTTWQAYNQYGGNSLYVGAPGVNPGRAYKVSYNRPFTTRDTSPEDWLFNAEYPMIRWLEANGYNVSYFTGVDADRRGAEILQHQVFLSVGHDEYWSAGQRANVEAARGAGKHLAFFSGNEVFWKTRWEASIDGSNTSYRTLVCYKETHANAKIDPDPAWTGTWRDSRPINPDPRPENALTGNIFTVNCCSYPMTVSAEDGKMRLWRNTSVASLGPEQTATFPDATVGYEWNEDLDNGARPPGTFRLSTTTVDVPQRILDQGSTYGPGTATHSLTMYRDASSALVFGAGTVQWIWGLDSHHDRGSNAPDVSMQQATVNLFADMGVQPGTLQSGLVAATASADSTPPASQVSSPAGGATLPSGSPFVIMGTAADSGGVVGGVEVSTDGGTTWHRASGRASWSYAWTPGAAGNAVIRSRAVDDSGNIETPSAGVSVTIGAASCPCSIWNDSFTPGSVDPNDHQSVELGVKFRSDVAGFITGIRFYKGPENTGTHVGNLWTSGGGLLGTATFSGESATGWQQVSFASPIAISPNTTYVASYFTPVGQYAFDGGYFASAFDNPPLHALADGTDGANGVYLYGGGFPTATFNKTNYWVDVVFTTSGGPDNTPPTVVGTIPVNGAPAVAAAANISASFSEPLDPTTVNSSTFTLQGPGGAVAATVTWDSSNLKAILDPNASLAFSTSYTATLKSGASGIKDVAGNALASDYVWSVTTAGPPPPPPDQGPGGPILVVAGTNAFGRYYAEILRTEGLNAFDVKDIGAVTAAVLGNYDVVILGEQPLTATQATMFSDWVNAGGNLIAMRPDSDLYGLLGITAAGGTLSNAYFQVDTSAAPGAGIVSQTMQFHGTADNYTLSGATKVATLYQDASTATASPAVTMRSVGTNGGHAAAFAFDLARSVVYTRQGNPAWAGDSRDGQDGPIRSDNLYFGAKSGDVQPDWVDFSRIAIPQADEAQRLLANLIGAVNLPRKPLPRFWYFPRGKKAVVIMTGDDHANGGTAVRFDAYKAASPAGCSVADWECIRSTSYIYPATPLTDAQAAGYEADGFEVALHVTTGCDNFTASSLESDFASQISDFTSKYVSVSPLATNRTHCIPWSDWSTHPKTELAHGIRLDANYYYWPGSWIQDRPGMFTGSGMPMRFGDLDGTMIDVYQATTEMTDESDQTFPKNIDALLDKATGPEGYFGAFTANMHTDTAGSSGSDAIVASAKSHNIPVVSSRQMLTWLDGRNGSSFQGLSWAANKLSFTISLGAGAANLQAMIPVNATVGSLTGVTRNGSPVAFTTQTIKGVAYAFVPALAGAYEAQYGVDTTPPVISALTATPGAGGTANFTWTTDEPSTSRVDFGTSAGSLSSSVSDGALVTSHTLTLTGLSAGTTYYYRATSADGLGNGATSPNPPAAPASFAMPSPSVGDTTVADFSAGTTDAGTAIAAIGDGDVILAPTVNEEFAGNSLPAGWSSNLFSPPSGSAVVSGGSLVVDGADAATDASYAPGRALEFVATFGSAHFQHVGFVNALAFDGDWIIFSTKDTSDSLYARTSDGQFTLIPGTWLNAPHRYRIEWNASNVLFFADGSLVATHAVSIAGPLRPVASDADPGGPALSVDWIRMTPYAASGSFTSRVLDAGQSVPWSTLSWNAVTPTGTSIALSVRQGDTAVPDGSWTAFASVANGGSIGGSSRYVQYRADLSTTDPTQTPVLQSVALSYSTVQGPAIAGFTPSQGAVGQTVVLSGSNLTGATAVAFNGTAATFTVNSAIQITTSVPSGATTGKISVTGPAGTATSATSFTVTSGPAIASFSPTAGAIGVKVAIAGSGFTGTTSVKFNGKAASFTVVSSTQITANVSTGTTTGRITVTGPGGTATSATDFTVVSPPTVTGFTPASGPAGTTVVVTGTNFMLASAVAFNTSNATFLINSATQITATVPSGATTGKIKVTNPASSASSVASFLVTPVISSFTPSSGNTGTSVVLTGTAFTGATSVAFNGTAATFTVNSATKITTSVPSGATSGPITVTTPGGTGTSASNFTVGSAPPAITITGFNPTSGPVGTSVTITGTGFGGASSVKFNGTAATFVANGTTQVTATVPSGATTGNVTVTATAGTATSSGAFTVTTGPAITGFTPASGPVGTSVVIAGSNFTGATAVQFNGTAANYSVDASTQITATVPSGATSGKITVAAPGGTATSATDFTVTSASSPSISGFTPGSGPVGTSIVIAGSNFTGATAVRFNGTAATFNVDASTQITATVPSGATSGKITVAAPGGTATSATDFIVTSSGGPTITGFTPTAGPINAKVTITGTGFTGTTSVKFNGKAASFTVNSATQISANVSAGTTSGKITVTAPGGTATSATDFLVVVPPTVSGFTPGSGIPGTTVVITGTNFDTASAVAFNGSGATFTIDSPTQITATVPAAATTGKIKVTNPAGAASSVASFLVPPVVTSFSPASGRVGTSVVINGKTFNGASSVQFNGVAATFSINSSSKITATVPSGATTGKISVTTPGGTALSPTDFTVTP